MRYNFTDLKFLFKIVHFLKRVQNIRDHNTVEESKCNDRKCRLCGENTFLNLFLSYRLGMSQGDSTCRKRIFAHLFGCTWLSPPVQNLQASKSHFSFLGAFRSGKLRGTTFRLTRDEILEDEKENLTVEWFCAPSGLTSAARHATVAFPLTYEKKSTLGCKRRIKAPCIQS